VTLPDTLDSRVWLTNEHPAWRRAWQPVGWVSDLPAGVPVPVRLGGLDLVLVLTPAGPHAYADSCPDGGAPLSVGRLDGDTLVCRHGATWLLDGADGGLSPLPTEERYGLVWIAPQGSVQDLPSVPEFDHPDFTVVQVPVQTWNASAAQMADNFLDVAHFPFTHRGSIGDPDDRLVAPYEVDREAWRFSVLHRHVTKTLTDSVDANGDFARTHRRLRFVGTAPHHVYILITYEDTGTTFALTFFHQAVDAVTTKLYCHAIRNDMRGPGAVTEADALAFQYLVANEDRHLLERFEVKAVPVQLGDELHVRADRITVELRRMLADLVALEAS
jgi:phenylpropionate dioxygenase-like ring-hydroxylating dioxygenase large terminal subunit